MANSLPCQRMEQRQRFSASSEWKLKNTSCLNLVSFSSTTRRHSLSGLDNQGFHSSRESLVDTSFIKQPQTCEIAEATNNEMSSASCQRAFIREVRVRPDGGRGWLVVASGALVTACTAGLLPCYGVLLPATVPPHKSHLWVWLAACAVALHSLTLPAWTFLISHLSSRKVAALGSLLCCIVFSLSFFNKSYTWLCAALIAAGLCTSACSSSSHSAVEDYFSHKLHTAQSLVNSGFGAGLLLWPRVLDFCLQQGTPRWTFLSVAVLAAIALLASSQFRPAEPYYKTYYLMHNSDVQEILLDGNSQDKSQESNSKLICAFLNMSIAVAGVSRTFVMILMPVYIISSGFEMGDVVTMFTFCGLTEFSGRLLSGWMLDLHFVHTSCVYLCTHLVMGLCVCGCAICQNFWVLLGCFSVVGLTWGFWSTLSTKTAFTLMGRTGGEDSLTTVNITQSLLAGVAPFVTSFQIPAVWICDSSLLCFGLIIILSFLVTSMTMLLYQSRKSSENV